MVALSQMDYFGCSFLGHLLLRNIVSKLVRHLREPDSRKPLQNSLWFSTIIVAMAGAALRELGAHDYDFCFGLPRPIVASSLHSPRKHRFGQADLPGLRFVGVPDAWRTAPRTCGKQRAARQHDALVRFHPVLHGPFRRCSCGWQSKSRSPSCPLAKHRHHGFRILVRSALWRWHRCSW